MRKIALIMDGRKRFITDAWPVGILQRLHETDEEANLYIFNSSGNWNSDKDYNAGEYNIYRLPDLTEFDGVILDLNHISSKKILQDVVQRVKKAGIPAISIGFPIEGLYYAGIDNHTEMGKMIGHLHGVHGCSSFWCIMGPADHYESAERTRSLKDYMTEKGIAFSEEDFWYGDLDVKSGMKGFEHLCGCHDGLPDAVLCINDNVAVGVCESAEAGGYSVPGDFVVTGFDNFDRAEHYIPSITTVEYNREKIGYLCGDILLRLWSGQQVPDRNYIAVEHIFQDSCGCERNTDRNLKQYLKNQIIGNIDRTKFNEEVLSLQAKMNGCNTIEEMMCCIPQCIPALKCDAVYLVLDEHIEDYKSDLEEISGAANIADDGFLRKGYPARMKVCFAYEEKQGENLKNREVTGIFPLFDCGERGRDFLFLPVHFGIYTIGYMVIRNATYLMKRQYLFQVMNVLTGAMESLYKKEKLEYRNRQLMALYIKDPLTGLYNRRGYQKLADNYFRIMGLNGYKVLVCFIDMDRLKYINDHYGHEYGDIAIRATAKAILKNCDKDAVPARTGGDEFVLVQSFVSQERVQELVGNIRRTLEQEAQAGELPFPLTISVGVAVADPDAHRSLSEYVKEADARMYDEKTEKRVARRD